MAAKILLLVTAFVDGIIIIMPVVSTTIPMVAIVTTTRRKTTKIVSVLFDRFLHSFNYLSPATTNTAANTAMDSTDSRLANK